MKVIQLKKFSILSGTLFSVGDKLSTYHMNTGLGSDLQSELNSVY